MFTAQDVCMPGYAKKVRDVPAEMKRQVYREYGITSHGRGDYEIYRLIPLELGGSNSIKNLWPESHRTAWNAQVKDRLESKLHELVCTANRATPRKSLSPQAHSRRSCFFGHSIDHTV